MTRHDEESRRLVSHFAILRIVLLVLMLVEAPVVILVVLFVKWKQKIEMLVHDSLSSNGSHYQYHYDNGNPAQNLNLGASPFVSLCNLCGRLFGWEKLNSAPFHNNQSGKHAQIIIDSFFLILNYYLFVNDSARLCPCFPFCCSFSLLFL